MPLKNSRRTPSRVVPAPAYVLEALSEHIRRYSTGERELVFTSAQGKPTASAKIAEALRTACRTVGLPDTVTHGCGAYAERGESAGS